MLLRDRQGLACKQAAHKQYAPRQGGLRQLAERPAGRALPCRRSAALQAERTRQAGHMQSCRPAGAHQPAQAQAWEVGGHVGVV